MVKVVWRKGALIHLNEHYNYIKKTSSESAINVRDSIFEMVEALAENPEIYPLDMYRSNNNGDIRAFEKYSLRVAYQVTEQEIRIIRVRHTKREPLKY
ncbi:type II toxin-antitoxin system RelE/ParE family toxin [Flavimarina sp. Hel_I_48]|uniref:type II toxin-antitoxin system RelE/ParE family toxin n=1 Tax=Flavimarina sp. Hel_I_48 TaxID=1392488 RepID=UPI0005681E64|nr:type II toxin-antitoxin system RelE/ParE family toxin [Flavimarina sp. Hel_I_48]